MAKLIKIFVVILLVIGAYFGFYRDRYIDYPIAMNLANEKGEVLSVRVLGRSDRIVNFQIVGDNRVHDYPISKVSPLSKAKLIFLPNKRVSSSTRTTSTSGSVAEMHMQGMQKQLAEYNTQMKLLNTELLSKATAVERQALMHEITELDITIKKLEYKMEVFETRSL